MQHVNSIEKLGIIAGNGRFPLLVAENARKMNIEVTAVAHIGETLQEIENHVDNITWIKVGRLGKMVDAFKKAGVTNLLMAGGITKTRLFTDVIPDLKAIKLLSQLAYKKDDMILRAIADFLENEGFHVRESHLFLTSLLAPHGLVCGKKPGKADMEDIRFGWEAAKEFGRLDVGQCVVVKNKVVLAVEAVEGTNATVIRAGQLCKGGAIVVKVSKPQQDLRFDVPAVGPETIKIMAESGASILAVEPERTLMLDKDDMLKLALKHKITILGGYKI